MGILVEFNPDLALRNKTEHKNGSRMPEECIPDPLEEGCMHAFLKKGQRNYWLEGEIPLVETEGGGKLSAPKASVVILESVHFNDGGVIWTRGKYRIIEVIKDGEIKFNGFAKTS